MPSMGKITVVHKSITYQKEKGGEQQGFKIDTYMEENLKLMVQRVKQKFDNIIIVTGFEGTGKSTNTMALAKIIDPSFPGKRIKEHPTHRTVERIVFSAEGLDDAIQGASVGQVIVVDESILMMYSGNSTTGIQKKLVQLFTTIRKKRLTIFLVIPNFDTLQSFFAKSRSICLIHFYTLGNRRGFYRFFSKKRKDKIYNIMKKRQCTLGQTKIGANFQGWIQNTTGFFFPVDDYEAKKDNATKKIFEEKKNPKVTDLKKQTNYWTLICYNLLRMQIEAQQDQYKGIPYNTDFFQKYMRDYFHIDMESEELDKMIKKGKKDWQGRRKEAEAKIEKENEAIDKEMLNKKGVYNV